MDQGIQLTFEDWQKGNFPPAVKYVSQPFSEVLQDGKGGYELYTLTTEEYSKIADFQNEAFNRLIDLFLKGQIDDFEDRFSNSWEKETLVEKEIKKVNQWLTDKDLSGEYIFKNSEGGSHNFYDLGGIDRKKGDDINLFPYWYNEIIIQGQDARIFIKPFHKNGNSLNYPFAVVVLYKFIQFLKGRKQNPQKGIAKTSTFEELFFSPSTMEEAVEYALKLGLVNTSYQWIYPKMEKPLAALWFSWKMKNLADTGKASDGPAVQIIAQKFGISVNKNTGTKFSQSELKDELKRLSME